MQTVSSGEVNNYGNFEILVLLAVGSSRYFASTCFEVHLVDKNNCETSENCNQYIKIITCNQIIMGERETY